MSGIIQKRVLEEIRSRNDIVDVVGSHFHLKRAGSSFTALCPFHKEKTPSFHVNHQRQIFHCFGCGAGGDVFGFVMQFEGVDFVTAAKMLAQRAGIRVEFEEGEGGGDKGASKETLYRIHEEVARFFQRCLLRMKSAGHARDYLKQRELPEEIADEFLVGYAPDRWDSMLQWAEKNKYTTDQLEEAGLILKSSKPDAASQFYDRFRDRLMFPIRDEQNRVIAFSGRCLREDDKTAKYVNSPETALFHKGRVLYALEKARRHIVESREAVVCEGQIDVIRCHSVGINTAVAAQGTAFTEEHARTLQRYADNIVVVFDSDKAGQDAAIRTATIFMAAGLSARVATLPDGEDPDSHIRKNGADAFRAILDRAASAVDYQIDTLARRENLKSEIGLMRAARAVLLTISHSPSPVHRARLVQEAAERLNLPPSAMLDDLRFILSRSRSRPDSAPDGAPDAGGKPARPLEEVELCRLMVHIIDFPSIGLLVEKYLPLDMLSDPLCRAVAAASLESAKGERPLRDILNDHADPTGELQKFAAAVQMAPSKTRGGDASREKAVKDLILGVWRREFKHERSELGDESGERRAQLTYHINRLKNWEEGAPIIEFELALARRPQTNAAGQEKGGNCS